MQGLRGDIGGILTNTEQKMKFSIKDLFSKCDQSSSFLQIWPHLMKISLMENFIFCAVKLMKFSKQFVSGSNKTKIQVNLGTSGTNKETKNINLVVEHPYEMIYTKKYKTRTIKST